MEQINFNSAVVFNGRDTMSLQLNQFNKELPNSDLDCFEEQTQVSAASAGLYTGNRINKLDGQYHVDNMHVLNGFVR
jgi:hypothetical protein